MINIFRMDPFVVHERDDWVFTLLRDMCLPANLVTTLAHYPSDVKKKKKKRSPSLMNFFKDVEENNRRGKTRDLFKKNWRYQGIFHARMGTIKDRNGKDLTDA